MTRATRHPAGAPGRHIIQGCFGGGGPRLTGIVQPRQAGHHPAHPPHTLQRAGTPYASALPDGFLSQHGGAPAQAIPDTLRSSMEGLFGADFSDVRVRVAHAAPAIGALAFTIGSDIYFAPGQYSPESPRGRQLLGHELTHVVQQRAGRVSNPLGKGLAVVQDPMLEAEAERMGLRAAALPAMPAARAVQPAAAGGRPAGAAAAQARPADHQLVIGAFMHRDAGRLAPDLAGHTFVGVRGPDGRQQTWGFSPRNYQQYDYHKTNDVGRLTAGVRGAVHDDAAALGRPGVRTRSYRVTAEQAQAAMAKVAEYQSGHPEFSLARRPCSTFALDVLRAARVDPFPGQRVRQPRDVFHRL